MTNEEAMSFWKGGDPNEVLRFTNPYDYEGCIIGVSTDGRAVYDIFQVFAYAQEQAGASDDDKDFVYQICDMINHDLRLYNPNDKIPVFFRPDLEEIEDEFCINDSPYGDFSNCILGRDWREQRYIFSLAQMVDELVKSYWMTKEEAVNYVYSLKKAGTVENDVYNYVIVDDLYEHIPLSTNLYQDNNDSYSPDFEKDCFELNGKDFLAAIVNQKQILGVTTYPRNFNLHLQIQKSDDNDSKILINATDGRILSRATLTALNKSTVTKPFYLHLNFIEFLISKISDGDTVKLFEGNGRLFVKVNDELYSTSFKEFDYPKFERAIPVNQPYKAEISTSDLRAFIDSINDKDTRDGIYICFENEQLSLKFEDREKTIPCTYDCEEGFRARLAEKPLILLTEIYKEKIVFEIKDFQSAFVVNMNNILTVFMPMRME